MAAQNVQLDFTLKPAAITAEATVTVAEPNAVDTSRTIVGGTVTTREIEALQSLWSADRPEAA